MNIPTTRVFGKVNEKYEEGGRADERGLAARQHGDARRDVDLNNGQRFILGAEPASAPLPADVTERELRENERLNNMVSKINDIVGPTGGNPAQAEAELRKRFEAMGFGDIMDSPTGRAMQASVGTIDPFEAGQMRAAAQPRQQLQEDDLGVPASSPSIKGQWLIDSMSAKTKSGQSVPVWQVRDGRSGMKHPHPFRLAETAGRVQAVLNRTGNVNDPRVAQWIEFDKRRQKLVGQIRTLKEAVKAGNRQMVGQLSEHQDALIELDAKIGL